MATQLKYPSSCYSSLGYINCFQLLRRISIPRTILPSSSLFTQLVILLLFAMPDSQHLGDKQTQMERAPQASRSFQLFTRDASLGLLHRIGEGTDSSICRIHVRNT